MDFLFSFCFFFKPSIAKRGNRIDGRCVTCKSVFFSICFTTTLTLSYNEKKHIFFFFCRAINEKKLSSFFLLFSFYSLLISCLILFCFWVFFFVFVFVEVLNILPRFPATFLPSPFRINGVCTFSNFIALLSFVFKTKKAFHKNPFKKAVAGYVPVARQKKKSLFLKDVCAREAHSSYKFSW